jgi:hypothetical protein
MWALVREASQRGAATPRGNFYFSYFTNESAAISKRASGASEWATNGDDAEGWERNALPYSNGRKCEFVSYLYSSFNPAIYIVILK